MNNSEHEKSQDERIQANAEAIKELTEYMRQIRDYHMPWAYSPWQTRLRKKVIRPILQISAAVTLGLTAFKGLSAYLEHCRLREMADRYAAVAHRLYEEENNPDVALTFIEKAIEIDPKSPEYIFSRAYMQGMAATRKLANLQRPYTKAELDFAHRSLAEAVYLQELQPDRPEPYILQAQILAALKETKRAKEAIEAAIERDPNNSFAYIRRAMVELDGEKDVAAAEASLAKAEAIDPESKWVWLWKGILAMDCHKDYATARSCCRKACELDAKFDLAHYNLAWALAKGKDCDYSQAREALKAALKINPEYVEALYAMGMFYGYEDNYPVAKVWLEKAIAVDPRFVTAHKYRGIVCGEMKDFDEAARSFGEAIKLDPMNADLYVRRAKVLLEAGESARANEDLSFARELDPQIGRTERYRTLKDRIDRHEKHD